jgi:probable O-glycosylation ligase (exosortase A-associated)
MLTGIGTIVGYVFWQEPKRFPRQREGLLLLILWGIFGLTTLFAIYPDRAWERFLYISKILGMVFLTTSIINSEDRLHWLLRVIALSLGYYGLKGGIFVLATGGDYTVWGPSDSFLYANNAIGLALAMNVPLLLYLWKIETRPWLRWTLMTMLILSYPAVVFTYSRGAWVGLAIITALLVLKSKHKFRLMAASAILGMVIIPSLQEISPQRLVDRYDALVGYQEETSAQSRFWNWEFCQRVGQAHPLVGGGFSFYSVETYQTYFPEFIERWPDKVWSCHSMWYTIFGEHGFPGLIVWVGLIGSCFLSLRRMHAYGKAEGRMAWVVDYADMLQTSLVGYVIVGTFYDAAYFDMFYYLVAILIIVQDKIQQTSIDATSASTAITSYPAMVPAVNAKHVLTR